MHTCTLFATYTAWLSRELDRTDPDLAGAERPRNMNKQQWARHVAERNQRHDGTTGSTASSSTMSNQSDGKFDEVKLEKMYDSLKKYEYNFSRHLQILLDALNHYAATETVVLLGLCARLSTANQGTEHSGLVADADSGV
jgi:gamma-tubulin complex component 2